jgi:hypothetical protein
LLESDSLCAEARRRTRLDDFGDPPIDPVLTVLVNSLETEADLHPHGRFLMRVHLRELLETRLRLAHAWSRQLEVLESSLIQRPLFITGMPRSGSTFLHELLAEDPENRAPRVWEVMFPLRIESEPSDKVDSRVQKTEACLCWFRRLAPGADSVYPMRARTPHECVAILDEEIHCALLHCTHRGGNVAVSREKDHRQRVFGLSEQLLQRQPAKSRNL